MPLNIIKKIFKKRPLNSKSQTQLQKVEAISSIGNFYTKEQEEIFQKIHQIKEAAQHLKQKKLKPHKVFVPALLTVVLPITIISTIFITAVFATSSNQNYFGYSIYASKPLVLGAMSSLVGGTDGRAEAINQLFDDYNCPMQDLGHVFVREADKNDIPYWLVASIAHQESNCGKKIPVKNGKPSYNAWGWGVWGDNVKMFDDWEHGIEVISKYMSDKFISQGITETCDIMKVYTPPSKGSWCAGVNFYRDRITNYKSNY